MLDIPNNLLQIRNEINQIATLNGRKPEELRLIAVSKTQSLKNIGIAYAAGQRDFAENYLQEAVEKILIAREDIDQFGPDLCWHFIGQIQSNKCQAIAQYFDWVHSLSTLKHAHRLNRLRPRELPPLQICIQVSLEQKEGRSGLDFTDVEELMSQLDNLDRITVRGLMCVLPESWRGDKAFQGFSKVSALLDRLKKYQPNLDTLSMGMSADYPEAIKAGASMLRLGTAIFGART